ncbi:glycosyl hydrolase family 95 catalytic domain-containing protein [Lentzea tibetensis]|uniref:glycosyl hydrolase family 95 catalytic domain-containing protein n=1 Tax=Lentzea tibetensis TaxID=2591470 RepID=UPI001C9923A9|nr:Tat pathway signal sequence domain protein [Lentzea tibetensis]
MPTTFYQGPFLGNGGLGAAVYRISNKLAFKLGDTRVRDHQGTGGTNFGNARLPIGHLTLNTTGNVTDVDLRLSLHNAELTGTVTTASGVLNISAYVHAEQDVLVVTATVKSGNEKVAWTFTPSKARSPRLDFKPAPSGLKTNPDPKVSGTTCTQDLAAGGQTVTKWQINGDTMYATVAHTFPDKTANAKATQTLAAATSNAQLRNEHVRWWNSFYPKSFVSVADTRLESFYWIQLYKLASATRRDRPVLGTCGPWLEPTPWPGTWWNLNVQLEYWILNATNHQELDSLSYSLDRSRDALVANVPSQYRSDSMGIARTTQEDLKGGVAQPGADGDPECGNLLWALHNAWLGYRHSMDDDALRNFVFPLLRKAVNYHLHFLTKDSKGVYHLPKTFSPEYASSKDCNYDLALLHWGCTALIQANQRLNLNDPLVPKWRDVLDNLTKPPQDSTSGYWIGADVKFNKSHRHYSHLLWFYPLYEHDVTTNAAHRDALTKSVKHWLSFTGAQQGYTFTGSGSMYALLGDGDKARGQLVTLLDKYVQPNTMYKESGPVIETPLSGAQTMHDMLVQSWGGIVRIFPAAPAAWASVTLHNVKTEGAFRISAVRKAGKTVFVRVKSEAGEPLRLHPGNLPGPVEVRELPSGNQVSFQQNADGTLTIPLARNQDVVISTKGANPDLVIEPAGANTKRYWGMP